jgi:hypothetical protein
MISPNRVENGPSSGMASIAAMPNKLRPILLALLLAGASAAVLGCGDSNGPDPSLAPQEAAVLNSKIDEIQDNVEVGSCLVASDKTDDLIADVQDLPSSVDSDVKTALENGANRLKLLLADPDQCEGRTTTSEPTTTSTPSTTESTTETRTRETTTTRTQSQPTTTTTPTQTQTLPSTTPGGSGGIGPGGL